MVEIKIFLYVIGTLFVLIGICLAISAKHMETRNITKKSNKRTQERGYGVCGMVTLILSAGFAGIGIGGAENNVIGCVFVALSAILLLFSLVVLSKIRFEIGEKEEC